MKKSTLPKMMKETRQILILNQLTFQIQIYQLKSYSHQLNLKKHVSL